MTDLFVSLFIYHFAYILALLFLAQHILKYQEHDE